MIEIGRDRPLATATRRIGWTLNFASAILGLIWLARLILGIPQYSFMLIVVSLGLSLLAKFFKVKTDRGPARAVSSLFGNLALWCLTTIITIWFLGWIASIQGDFLPPVFYTWIPDLAIGMIFLALVSVAAGVPPMRTRRLRVTSPGLLLRDSYRVDMGDTKLSSKSDSVGLPIRKSSRTVGCVVFGDVKAEFDTPMGKVNAVIKGPVTTFGVPFKGMRASGEEVQKMSGKKLNELLIQTEVETSMVGEAEIELDLPPFVHVRRDEFQDSVEVGPISVKSGPKGDFVKIGPISIDADEHSDRWFSKRYWGHHGRFSRWWSVKGAGDWSYVTCSGGDLKAKWNGSQLELRGSSMKLKVGSDGFGYSPNELETFTPLHTLKVTQEKVTLDTKRFTLDIAGERVILRTEDGSKRTDSAELARDLRALLADTAKRQVSDVLEGQPIELDEMLNGTEELLKKYA